MEENDSRERQVFANDPYEQGPHISENRLVYYHGNDRGSKY